MTIEEVIRAARDGKESKDIPYLEYQAVGLDEDFAAKVRELKETLDTIEYLKRDEARLRKVIQGKLAERGRERAQVRDLRVLAYLGSNSLINKKLLVENGVPMDKIELSTRVVTYVAMKITRE